MKNILLFLAVVLVLCPSAAFAWSRSDENEQSFLRDYSNKQNQDEIKLGEREIRQKIKDEYNL